MLLAARESAVTKKPRLRFTMRRSSSVRPRGSFHSSMSRLMLISCGIQWLAQAARYFSQAHLYLNGTSWFTSALELMMLLSSTLMRRCASAAGGLATSAARDAGTKPGCGWIASPETGFARASSSKLSITGKPRSLTCFAFGVVDGAELRLLRRSRGGVGAAAAGRDRVQRARLAGGLLGVGGAHGAQVVGGLQAADPGQLVGIVQRLAGGARHVDVERLRLVDPLLAP